MPETDQQERRGRPLDVGVFARPPARGPGAAEAVAGVLSLLWLAAVAIVFLGLGTGPEAAAPPGPAADDGAGGRPGGWFLVLVATVLPIALIWLAAATARSARALREETAQLRSTVEAMRHAQILQAQQAASAALLAPSDRRAETARAAAPSPPPPPPGLQEEAAAMAATFASRRDAPRPPAPRPPPEEQPALALDAPAEAAGPALTPAEVIRALDFPDSADDAEGFRALRAGLRHRELARLIRASQDVLTLLGQDGIYMDDFVPDRARPELWRRFAEGERGRAVAALGGIHDREVLARIAARMRADTVFRDAAHHFLRQFDRGFSAFAAAAGDAEIAAYADTRTARAFMLIGRVSGTFD